MVASPRPAALVLAALLLVGVAHGGPERSPVVAWSLGDLPALEVQRRPRGADLRLTAYPGGASLASWRASLRGPLAVLLSLPSAGASFLSTNALRAPGLAAPETCVPPSYRWDASSLRWGRLLIEKEAPIWEEFTSFFEPRLCKVTTTQRAEVKPLVLTRVGDEALLAYRHGDDVIALAPRSARVVADEPGAILYGSVIRGRLSLGPGGARHLEAGFGKTAFSVELVEGGPGEAPSLTLRSAP